MSTTPHYRLRPDVVQRWTQRRGRPKSEEFRKYFRKVKHYRGSPEHWWAPLMEGEPIPEIFARAVVEFMHERMHLADVTFESIFMPASPRSDGGVWKSPHDIFQALTTNYAATGEMFLHHPTLDPLAAAEMIVRTVGHKAAGPGDSLAEVECLRRGEEQMRRSVDQYAAWLRKMSKDDQFFRTVMYYVHRSRRLQLGATVVLPLRKEPFDSFCAGEVSDDELQPSDLDPEATRLVLCAMSDAEGIEGVSAREKSVAQVRTIYYQFAYFTRHMKPLQPEIAIFITNPHYGDLLHRQGFVDTGNNLKGTSFPMAVLRPPQGRYTVQRWVPYKLLVNTLKIYRLANRIEWRREDRARDRLS